MIMNEGPSKKCGVLIIYDASVSSCSLGGQRKRENKGNEENQTEYAHTHTHKRSCFVWADYLFMPHTEKGRAEGNLLIAPLTHADASESHTQCKFCQGSD